MKSLNPKEITRLLNRVSDGEKKALDELIPLIYGELREIAHRHLLKLRPGNTLNTTDLVHEAYLKLTGSENLNWQNRAHFFAASATIMRNLLIDYARARQAQRRGGGNRPLPLDEATRFIAENRARELIDLDNALTRLAAFDAQKAKTIEYKFYGGLTNEETAAVLGISASTVKREFRLARAWLFGELNAGNFE